MSTVKVTCNFFDRVPDYVLFYIFKHFSDYDLSIVRKVSRRFYFIAIDRTFVK